MKVRDETDTAHRLLRRGLRLHSRHAHFERDRCEAKVVSSGGGTLARTWRENAKRESWHSHVRRKQGGNKIGQINERSERQKWHQSQVSRCVDGR